MKRRKPNWICDRCGYDLNRPIAGVCPECGTETKECRIDIGRPIGFRTTLAFILLSYLCIFDIWRLGMVVLERFDAVWPIQMTWKYALAAALFVCLSLLILALSLLPIAVLLTYQRRWSGRAVLLVATGVFGVWELGSVVFYFLAKMNRDGTYHDNLIAQVALSAILALISTAAFIEVWKLNVWPRSSERTNRSNR